MSLKRLEDGWCCFGQGRRWRCSSGSRFLCEVDSAGVTPNYLKMASTVTKIKRIKAFYRGRLTFGQLDEMGFGLDVLVANSLTESFGTVPSPLDTKALTAVYNQAGGLNPGVRLDEVVRHIARTAKFLERREPGYINPVATPGRVSVGAHHVLIATALGLKGMKPGHSSQQVAQIADLVCRVPAESLYAAQLAITYFNRSYSKHFNQPPLLAATYNAGSPRSDGRNRWNLRQYGEHIDRWIAYFNTSRMVA